jgi:hypothetical protein
MSSTQLTHPWESEAVATLHLRIVSAEDLLAKELGGSESHELIATLIFRSSNPYVSILVDDDLVEETKHVSHSLAPLWDESFTIPLLEMPATG